VPFLILEVVVFGAVFLSVCGEVWFLAKSFMALSMPAAPALIFAIIVALVLVAPAVWLVWKIVGGGYAAMGRKAQLRTDFGRSLWISRTGTWRPGSE